MVPSYVEKICQWPTPSNAKQLKTLIGFLSYYRQFIPAFSELMSPINALRGTKGNTIVWSEKCQRNLERLKAEFATAPVRSTPCYDGISPFVLTTDYSRTAVAAVLSQVQGEKERLIAAVGRKCTTGEANYPSWKGELAALVFGIRKFNHILSFKKFEVHICTR